MPASAKAPWSELSVQFSTSPPDTRDGRGRGGRGRAAPRLRFDVGRSHGWARRRPRSGRVRAAAQHVEVQVQPDRRRARRRRRDERPRIRAGPAPRASNTARTTGWRGGAARRLGRRRGARPRRRRCRPRPGRGHAPDAEVVVVRGDHERRSRRGSRVRASTLMPWRSMRTGRSRRQMARCSCGGSRTDVRRRRRAAPLPPRAGAARCKHGRAMPSVPVRRPSISGAESRRTSSRSCAGRRSWPAGSSGQGRGSRRVSRTVATPTRPRRGRGRPAAAGFHGGSASARACLDPNRMTPAGE